MIISITAARGSSDLSGIQNILPGREKRRHRAWTPAALRGETPAGEQKHSSIYFFISQWVRHWVFHVDYIQKGEIDFAAAEASVTLCWCLGENETDWEVSLLGWKPLTSSQTLLTFLKLHCDPEHRPRKPWTFKHTGQAARWTLTWDQ